jgi:excisionase family DNA binding protein
MEGAKMVESSLISVQELAHRLSVSAITVYRKVWSGEIQSVKVGRLRRIPESEISKFVEAENAGAGETKKST